MTTIEQTAVNAHIKSLVERPWFSAVEVRLLLRALKLEHREDSEDFHLLRLMHCVEWKDIPDSVQEEMGEILNRLIAPE